MEKRGNMKEYEEKKEIRRECKENMKKYEGDVWRKYI